MFVLEIFHRSYFRFYFLFNTFLLFIQPVSVIFPTLSEYLDSIDLVWNYIIYVLWHIDTRRVNVLSSHFIWEGREIIVIIFSQFKTCDLVHMPFANEIWSFDFGLNDESFAWKMVASDKCHSSEYCLLRFLVSCYFSFSIFMCNCFQCSTIRIIILWAFKYVLALMHQCIDCLSAFSLRLKYPLVKIEYGARKAKRFKIQLFILLIACSNVQEVIFLGIFFSLSLFHLFIFVHLINTLYKLNILLCIHIHLLWMC